MAQCLLLYNLEIKSIDRCETKDLMEIFQVSYATINRSLRWLSENGLVSLEGKRQRSKIDLLRKGTMGESHAFPRVSG